MPLEDDLCDIIKKARAGMKLSVGELARLTGLPGADISALERGGQVRDRSELRAIASALGLRLTPLEQIVLDKWVPQSLPSMPGIETVCGEISGYAVKGYVVWMYDCAQALGAQVAKDLVEMRFDPFDLLGRDDAGAVAAHGLAAVLDDVAGIGAGEDLGIHEHRVDLDKAFFV